jgi:hypothetical protein
MMIKQWTFKNAQGKSQSIELFADGVWSVEPNGRFKHEFDRVWREKIYRTPISIMQELYREIAIANLGAENRHKRFWRLINLDALNECVETVQSNSRRDTLRLTRNGVELETNLDIKNNYAAPSKTEETLDRAFFFGFEQWGVPMSLRKKIRETILSALSTESGFALRDAFPLIDYDKIQTESITTHFDDLGGSNTGGKFQFLHKESVEIGGWDRGGGGSKTVSLERFLANEWNIQSEAPPLFLARIQDAIIQE